jgi:hypothetical protein
MSFTAPLGLLALLAVPAVVVLHLFRTRLPERRVAGSFLFPPQALHASAGRTRSRLLRTPSLWCELLAALLLALWLGGLSFGGREVRPLVVVLDDTASMAAAGARERALALLRDRLRARPAGAFLSVLRSGRRPEALLDARDRGADLEAALARWRPAQPRHDLRLTLELARGLAGHDGDVWFVTDEPLAGAYDDVTVLACGVPAPNAALQTVERTARASGGEQLHVRVAAFGALAGAQVAIAAAGRTQQHALEFTEGAADLVVPLPDGSDVVHVRLQDDALALDNEAWVLPPAPHVVAVADALPAARRDELGIERVFGALVGWRSESETAQAQLVLRAQPGEVRDGQLEVVVVPGDGERAAFAGPFVVDRASPCMRAVSLQGVVWVAGAQELPGQALIAAGPQVLASEEPLEHGRRLWLRVVGATGNVVRAPDWPVLFANLLESCRAEVEGVEKAQVLVGEEARCRTVRRGDENESPLVLERPDGTRTSAAPGRIASWQIERPGVHRVLGAGEREVGRFASRFVDPSESDLRALATFERAGRPTPAAERAMPVRDTGIERRVLGWLVLLFVALDWWLLARRAA